LLEEKGIPFEEIDVTTDTDARQALALQSGRRTVPVIYIDDEPIGGWDELRRLFVEGKLDHLVA
jgi:glutaredoxin 3